jgi:type IV pilus assembly protein PilW
MATDGVICEMMPLNLRKENRGFTLIELLVAMGLGLVVLGAVLKVFVSQNRTNVAQQEVAYAQQNVRAAMDLMAREIRNAGYDPEDNNFEAIKTATSGSIRILSNLSGDDEAGDPNDPNEDVTYTVNGSNQLTRSGNRMVDFVNNLQFGYVLKDGTVLDPPGAALTAEQRADVRTVIIRLGVRTENPDRDTGDFRVRNLMSRVRIRNMGFQDIET